MTTEEAAIAQQYQYLVTTKLKNSEFECLNGGTYRIMEITRGFNKISRSWDYSLTLENEHRTRYIVQMSDVIPMPGFDVCIQNKLKERHNLMVEQITKNKGEQKNDRENTISN